MEEIFDLLPWRWPFSAPPPPPTSMPGASRQVTCSKMGRGCLYFSPPTCGLCEWF